MIIMMKIEEKVEMNLSKILDKWLCKHDWRTYHVIAGHNMFGEILEKHTLICKLCGKIKKVNVS